MSDPILPEGVGELGKLGASGGIGSILTLLLGRLFKSQDKASEQILVEVKALTVSVGALTSQLAVLTSGTVRRDADVARLEEEVRVQGKEIAAIKATIEQISEGLLR